VVKNSQKLDRFFTDFFTGRGWGGLIWLDLVGLGWTDSDSADSASEHRTLNFEL